jgi:hypothetical protein
MTGAALVGIPVPELCFTAHSKGYAADRAAEAYAMQLVQRHIMDENFNVIDAASMTRPFRTVKRDRDLKPCTFAFGG